MGSCAARPYKVFGVMYFDGGTKIVRKATAWSAIARSSIAALATEETNAKQPAIEKVLLPNMMEGAKQGNKLVSRAGCMKCETFTLYIRILSRTIRNC
jgi:hypothetical protein